MAAFSTLIALAAGAIVLRHVAFIAIIDLTLKMMADIAADAFHRVQRFSTDWHANSFAGSTVRKVTRGMWALDLLNDTILVALLPSMVMLVGSTVLLGWHWPLMGLIIAVGSLVYCGADGGAVARLCRARGQPCQCLGHQAWRRAGRRRQLQLGGQGLRRGSARGQRASRRSSPNGDTARGGPGCAARSTAPRRARRCWCCASAIIGFALLLWSGGQASAGDITFVLTSFFLLQGYLRDVGMHIRNLQRSVNDMEELVDIQGQPLGVADRPRCRADPYRQGRHTLR